MEAEGRGGDNIEPISRVLEGGRKSKGSLLVIFYSLASCLFSSHKLSNREAVSCLSIRTRCIIPALPRLQGFPPPRDRTNYNGVTGKPGTEATVQQYKWYLSTAYNEGTKVQNPRRLCRNIHVYTRTCTVLHPKRVHNALFHSMWIFSAILQAIPNLC